MTTHITKILFNGEKVVAQEIPEADIYLHEALRLAELCEGSANAGSTEPWTRRQAASELRRLHEEVTALRRAIAEAELVKSAEEAYEAAEKHDWVGVSDERLMEMPEFIKHTVEATADWSEWVCPDPESYLMKCCDCGLVHEAQFGVVRYKSETEREDCDKVDNPNLQAVFRMRRHEAWEPEDTAHRAGGLPMEQAQPVAINWGGVHEKLIEVWNREISADEGLDEIQDLIDTTQPQRKPEQSQPVADVRSYEYSGVAKNGAFYEAVLREGAKVSEGDKLYTTPPQRNPDPVIDKSAAIRIATALGWAPPRQPLTDEKPQRWAVFCGICRKEWSVPYQHPGKSVCAECEAAHGIKENT